MSTTHTRALPTLRSLSPRIQVSFWTAVSAAVHRVFGPVEHAERNKEMLALAASLQGRWPVLAARLRVAAAGDLYD